VGVDGATALVRAADGTWTVDGVGEVTLYHGRDTTRFGVGDAVPGLR
jgi:hypothetical protein